MSEEQILVEGNGDKYFITGFLGKIGLGNVIACPPKQLDAKSDGIDNLMKIIPLLINKIKELEVSKAAIMIDADYAGHGNGGFHARRQQITDRLALEGYIIDAYDPKTPQAGEIFTHPGGLAQVGLFIMPNHKDDGMLEDMLKNMVTDAPYADVMKHAISTVDALPNKLFDTTLHTSKAEIGTFMAWQRKPPAHAGASVRDNIFDVNATACAGLTAWLNAVFGASAQP
jgi:hypothetical protein